MTTNEKQTSKTGPQGTQVFELNEVNKMIAKEIVESQPESADTPALIGVSSDVIGQQFTLQKSKIEVGRRPSSDIVLTESSVSSMHAQIIKDHEAWKVLNLLSSNGTFVNGEKVVEKFLNVGDVVGFAGSEFVFALVVDDQPEEDKKPFKHLIPTAIFLASAAAVLIYFLYLNKLQ